MSTFGNTKVCKHNNIEVCPYCEIDKLLIENNTSLKNALLEAEKRLTYVAEEHNKQVFRAGAAESYNKRLELANLQYAAVIENLESRLRDVEMREAGVVEALVGLVAICKEHGLSERGFDGVEEMMAFAESVTSNLPARTSDYNEVIEAARKEEKKHRKLLHSFNCDYADSHKGCSCRPKLHLCVCPMCTAIRKLDEVN